MRSIVALIVAGGALVFCLAGAAPLAAQCMACVSSSACAESSKRGNCRAECVGTACACSDTSCRPGITAAPVGDYSILGAADEGGSSPQAGTLGVLVRECDGTLEFLVYSADGTRLIESRLLARGGGEPAATRPARAEASSGLSSGKALNGFVAEQNRRSDQAAAAR
jgi:hypothetical protein